MAACDPAAATLRYSCYRRLAGAFLLFLAGLPAASAQQIDVLGPPGSGRFGASAVFLSNGDFLVADPGFDGDAADVGAVYLYRRSGELVSRVTGSTANDRIGSGGLFALPGGNAVICSPDWDNGSVVDSGAATWIDGDAGLSGTLSAINSLVADVAGSRLCNMLYGGVVVLTNGNYVVASPDWAGVGAMTWGGAASGVRGVVGSTNSLVGSAQGDFGSTDRTVVPLTNGSYVVVASSWNAPLVADVGAVAWGDGSRGSHGVISAQNALVGDSAYSATRALVTPLTNGHYVVSFPNWHRDAAYGAVVWSDGTTGRSGFIDASIALVGTHAQSLADHSVLALSNGNYLLKAPNADVAKRGALTWGDGDGGTTGVISAANSIVGARDGDQLGTGWAQASAALTNGNYVVCSDSVLNVDATAYGACVWGDGSRPTSAVIASTNALFGTGSGSVIALTNGHFVIGCSFCTDAQGVAVGAAFWHDGRVGLSGFTSDASGMAGSTLGDQVGYAIALDNGKYALLSSVWNDGTTERVGAVTVLDGSGPTVGRVSALNSLIGTTYGDRVGQFALALPQGRLAIAMPNFSIPPLYGVGAVVWIDGNHPVVGRVTPENALYGTESNQWFGVLPPVPLPGGNFAVSTPDPGSPTTPRRWSFGRAHSPIHGPVDAFNTVSSTGRVTRSYDAATDTLLVGRATENRVTLFRPDLLFTTRGD